MPLLTYLISGVILATLQKMFPRVFAVVMVLLIFLVFIPVIGWYFETGFIQKIVCSALSNFDMCNYSGVNTGAELISD
jgi:predicted PurR-regulated permease PerM